MKKKVHAGFSIIEIMVALGIVLSMAVAILPVGNNYFALGSNSSSKTGVATLATAISQYKFETGEYPLNLNSLTVSNEQYGPYISSAALRDPWNQNYNYSYNDNSFAVWSNGPDKKNNSGGGVPAAFQGDDIGVIGH